MLFKGVLIGLELREFDRMCAMRLVFPRQQEVVFGKNQSCNRRYDLVKDVEPAIVYPL